MVVVDGAVCAVGLEWREALVEANHLIRALSAGEPDDAVVTISEMVLAEPLISWRRIGRFWECCEKPTWRQDAA